MRRLTPRAWREITGGSHERARYSRSKECTDAQERKLERERLSAAFVQLIRIVYGGPRYKNVSYRQINIANGWHPDHITRNVNREFYGEFDMLKAMSDAYDTLSPEFAQTTRRATCLQSTKS